MKNNFTKSLLLSLGIYLVSLLLMAMISRSLLTNRNGIYDDIGLLSVLIPILGYGIVIFVMGFGLLKYSRWSGGISTKSAFGWVFMLAGFMFLIEIVYGYVMFKIYTMSIGADDSGLLLDEGMSYFNRYLIYSLIASLLLKTLLALAVLTFAGQWKVYKKAGEEGWASLIPLYNTWVLVRIAEVPTYYFFLLFIPIVNIVISILIISGLSSRFGKSGGFTAGLIFLPFIFYPILGFGEDNASQNPSEYSDPAFGNNIA